MHAHTIETPPPRTTLDDTAVSVTPVGTFAAGQSAEGAFAVVAGAEVGSFASEPDEQRTREAE